VGTKLPNQFGLYDMSGNVWEWCQDYWHGSYTDAPSDGNAWLSPTSSYRVLRGGTWYDYAYLCRSAFRLNLYFPAYRFDCIGARFVLIETTAPTVASFSINDGASSTTIRSVTLNNSCTGSPMQYMANESSSFTPAPWQTYSTNPSFELSAGNGTKTVYFKVRNAAAESQHTSDTIVLDDGTGPSETTVYLPGDVPLVFVRIPARSFQMGSPDTERSRYSDEGPVHTVNIAYSFYMGKTELTQKQWLAVIGSWPGTAPSSTYGVGDNYPAYCISWDDCQNFVTALNQHITNTAQGPATFRLPSEAEWEYACRAGTQTRFFFGDSLSVDDVVADGPAGTLPGNRSDYMWFLANNSPYGTKSVGMKLPNQFGLYDMSGNVYEWCQDYWHDNYTGAPTDGSAWLSPTWPWRVVRGGTWYDDAAYCRSANRPDLDPAYRSLAIGARFVRTQPPQTPTPTPTSSPTLTPTPTPTPGAGPEETTVYLPSDAPMVFVRVPAGSFQMGSPDTERSRHSDEGPVHTVTITYDFYMGKTELTQRQWLAVMGSWPGSAPSSTYGVGDNYPAYFISWSDCENFIAALNQHVTDTAQGPATFRLPSEAEWEYACRAGTQTRFFFGDSLSVDDLLTDGPAGTLPGNRSDYMWFLANNSPNGTKPVGTKIPNQFGLYDMSGNVWEWCRDYWHGSYTGAPTDGSAWLRPTSSYWVLRGGSWYLYANHCRSAYRDAIGPGTRSSQVGARFVRTQ
jgi:formylglycine-generating enzyme required for sulfatase activity